MRILRTFVVPFLVCLALITSPLGCDSDGGDDNSGTSDTTGGGGGQDVTGGGGGGGGGQAVHPHWANVDWEEFLPAAEESAVYAVTTFGGEAKELAAHVERGVQWQGETWDRIVIGELEAGRDGSAIYLDLSSPWSVRVKGVENYAPSSPEGPSAIEMFADPITLPLNEAVGVPTNISTTISGNYNGYEADMSVNYSLVIDTYDGTVEVPGGTLTGCVIMTITLSGELIGDGEIEVEVIAHPEQKIVKWTDAPGFMLVELKELWD